MAETAATGRLERDLFADSLVDRWASPEVGRLEASFHSLMQTVEESLRDRERSYVEAVGAVVAAIDARDHETTGHSFRVAHYALTLAKGLGVDGERLQAIEWGALLHDVGKIAVPDAILRKADRLHRGRVARHASASELGVRDAGGRQVPGAGARDRL